MGEEAIPRLRSRVAELREQAALLRGSSASDNAMRSQLLELLQESTVPALHKGIENLITSLTTNNNREQQSAFICAITSANVIEAMVDLWEEQVDE